MNPRARLRTLSSFLSVGILVWSLNALAANSFRLHNGRLITTGMTQVEVLDLIGEPLSRDTHIQALSLDGVAAGKSVETWSYLLQGSIGGEFYLTLTLENGLVTMVHFKQRGRI